MHHLGTESLWTICSNHRLDSRGFSKNSLLRMPSPPVLPASQPHFLPACHVLSPLLSSLSFLFPLRSLPWLLSDNLHSKHPSSLKLNLALLEKVELRSHKKIPTGTQNSCRSEKTSKCVRACERASERSKSTRGLTSLELQSPSAAAAALGIVLSQKNSLVPRRRVAVVAESFIIRCEACV